MLFLEDLRRIKKNQVLLAGGKGASLGELTRMNILVPDGFVILSCAFERFLTEADLNTKIKSILDVADKKELKIIAGASEKIKELIFKAQIPKQVAAQIKEGFNKLNSEYVAVRSSATAEDSIHAAWAGQLESYLNTTEVNLLENIKKCWASLFNSRAIYYRINKGLLHKKISIAVIVQKMIKSEKSGIAFSTHPITQNTNQVVIEAGFGLGEAIVSGHITPDNYLVEKEPRKITDLVVNNQTKMLHCGNNAGNQWSDIPKDVGGIQTLTNNEILKLSGIVCDIEKKCGYPCDIEWASERDIFYILQVRPITTLK